MRVVIHGGMHKTATTSLQHVLYKYRGELKDYGIFYPDLGSSHHEGALNVKNPAWKSESVKTLVEDARSSRAEILFVSAEVVSTFSGDQFRRLRECFSEEELTYVFCCNCSPHPCDRLGG